MDKRLVIPIAAAIVVGGGVAVVASKILAKPKKQDETPALSPSGETVELTETQRVLRDRETWLV